MPKSTFVVFEDDVVVNRDLLLGEQVVGVVEDELVVLALQCLVGRVLLELHQPVVRAGQEEALEVGGGVGYLRRLDHDRRREHHDSLELGVLRVDQCKRLVGLLQDAVLDLHDGPSF